MSNTVKKMAAESIGSLFNSVRVHFLRILKKKTLIEKLREAGL